MPPHSSTAAAQPPLPREEAEQTDQGAAGRGQRRAHAPAQQTQPPLEENAQEPRAEAYPRQFYHQQQEAQVRPVSATPPGDAGDDDEDNYPHTMMEAGPGGPEHAARISSTVYHYPLPQSTDGESAVFRSQGAGGPRPRRWVALEPLNIARGRHHCAVLEGRVYAIGGVGPRGRAITSVECFDPETMKWTEVAPLPAPRRDFGCVVVHGMIIVAGGTASPLHPDLLVDDGLGSDDAEAPPKQTGPPPKEGLDSSGDEVSNAHDGAVRSVFAYDPHKDEWRSLPPLLRPRQGLACESLGEVIFAIGGSSFSDFTPGAPRLQSMEYLRLGAKEWGAAGSMAAGRSHFACGTLKGLAASDLNAASIDDLL